MNSLGRRNINAHLVVLQISGGGLMSPVALAERREEGMHVAGVECKLRGQRRTQRTAEGQKFLTSHRGRRRYCALAMQV